MDSQTSFRIQPSREEVGTCTITLSWFPTDGQGIKFWDKSVESDIDVYSLQVNLISLYNGLLLYVQSETPNPYTQNIKTLRTVFKVI